MDDHLQYLVNQSWRESIITRSEDRTRSKVDYNIDTDLYHYLRNIININFNTRDESLSLRPIIIFDVKNGIWEKWQQVNKSSVLKSLLC